jgi:hypothetical protein
MKRAFSFCLFHWRKFAWGGTGVAISTLGTQLDKPYASWCYVAACLCGIIAANDRPEPSCNQSEGDEK